MHGMGKVPSKAADNSLPADGTGAADGFITQVSLHKAADFTDISADNLSPINAADYRSMLPPPVESIQTRPCLVLDLDETLVHSSFKPVAVPDCIIPVEIKGTVHQVYVRLRPFAHQFMKKMAERFEVVVFTASLSEYADPLLDEMDPDGSLIHHRLFREHCSNTNGLFVKDLSLLGRPLPRITIIDNSPTSFLFQPRNSIQCTSWFEDNTDTELQELIPVLEEVADSDSAYAVLDKLRMHRASGGSLTAFCNSLQQSRNAMAASQDPERS
eukprot:NODE_3246_length_1252_cov_105.725421_g3082_i0.p1 GENE.NODE_3246_length_1252_cov_105.725421_g3082_i0~~NODE_3246_length_1252_cov_105.725421_g3082_i0.p1  ORF type:complete len:292 (+),score=43.95 NODE_3246_length_1252_cov_105.725421_g3082_i0:64-876(+)